MVSIVWVGIIGFALLLSIVALIVASVVASQENSTVVVPQYMIRSTVDPQAITAGTVTPLLFETQITTKRRQ